jgi:hypothetical protein
MDALLVSVPEEQHAWERHHDVLRINVNSVKMIINAQQVQGNFNPVNSACSSAECSVLVNFRSDWKYKLKLDGLALALVMAFCVYKLACVRLCSFSKQLQLHSN